MCKTISHAVYACSIRYKLCSVLKRSTKSKHVYERDVK